MTRVLHESAFGYLLPSEAQKEVMNTAREAAADYADKIEALMPDGPDKTYALRKLREVAMWVNIGITRFPDGKARP